MFYIKKIIDFREEVYFFFRELISENFTKIIKLLRIKNIPVRLTLNNPDST